MRVRALVRNLLRRDAVERELDDELRGYCALLEAEKIAAGTSVAEARREARIELGGIEQVKESVRSARMGALVEQLLQDLKYGARMLRRNPVFTGVAIATLALGIGANAAIFTVVDAVLFRPLPFGSPEALFAIDGLSYTGEYLELRKRAATFDVAAHETRQSIVTGLGEPLRVPVAAVTAHFMELLQAAPALGRALRDGDERAAEGEVVVISHSFWRTQLGGDPRVVGRTVTLDGRPRSIAGVMPPSFGFPSPETQLWTASAIDPSNRIALWSTSRRMIGRLRPGATLASAGAELAALGPAMRPLFPWGMPAGYGTAVTAVPLQQSLVSDVRPMLLLLLGAAGLVLLIATVNVSNLLVARTLARGRELGIRAALGAARGRILRQVWTEGFLLVLLGALAALPVAYVGVEALRTWSPAEMPRTIDAGLDLRLLFAGGLAIVAAVFIVGGVPALRASRVDLAARLAEGGRQGQGRQTRWTSNVLVGAQMALAIALVITAVLLTRSLANLYAAAPGFRPDSVVSARISPPAFRYREIAARRAFYESVLERLQATPGISSVALTDRLTFGGETYGSVFIIEGRPDPTTTGEWPIADVSGIVSPAFFATLGIPVKEGRAFTAADAAAGERVVVINESLARKYWPNESPVGRRFGFPGDKVPRTIVGVVGDVKWERVTDEGRSALYVPLAQGTPSAMRIVIRSGDEPGALVEQLRTVVRSLDRDTPVDQPRSMEELIGGSVEGPRLAATLIGGFALAGLLLGAIGIYGTLSDVVTQRRREIGVRMALGAGRGDIYRAVLGGTLTVVATGAVAGIIGAAAAVRLFDAMLFGVAPADPVTFAVAVILLGITAAVAAFVPARRASTLDPLAILKVD